MADLSDVEAAGSTKIIGSDSNGLESTPVNSTANGALHVNLRDNAGDELTVLPVVLTDYSRVTYSAASLASNLPTLATDFFTITGSATKTIRILSISCEFVGGGVVVAVQLLKRSTANINGTSTTLTAVPHDSTNGVATATARVYTVNPGTLGTLVGALRAERTPSPLASSTTNPENVRYEFGIRPSQPITLRGTGEVLAFNLNGTTLSGGAVSVFVEWTEQ